MNSRSQAACAWAGLVAVPLILVGFVLAGYFPPPKASASAAEVAAYYAEGTTSIRLGLLVLMVAMAGYAAVVSVARVQVARIEGPRPALATLQAVTGTCGYVLLTLFVILLAVAAFRPERAPELTQMAHDAGWCMAFLAAVPFAVQALAVGFAVLSDRSPHPVYPRWLGYAGLWEAVLLLPGDILLFFHTGPFAYDGIISYWIPVFAFGGWLALLAWAALRAARADTGVLAEPAADDLPV